jgi:hypothetical protein
MTMPLARGWARPWLIAVSGILAGFAYTLSPLTVLSLVVIAGAAVTAGRGLSPVERRWFWSVVPIGIGLRLAVIALLFLTADPSHPFASFFGDEELYKFRSIWLRNIGQAIPIAPSDVIYSFDPVGRTGHMYVLALVQAVVGDAPYGLHLLTLTLYLCGVLALYRFMRPAYGSVVAMAGLAGLLFLPSLLLWSISILKEPMNVFMLTAELICAAWIVRAPRVWQKLLAAAGVAAFALAMESLRAGGVATALVGTIGGFTAAYLVSRGRRLVTAAILAPVAIAILFSTAAVQERVMAAVRRGAHYHAGHVLTPGFSYQLVQPRYYIRRDLILSMPPVDAGRYAVKAIWSYFAEPLPWRTESRVVLAYLPEQFLWYLMALLLPIGVVAGLRRDVLVTSLLAAHAGAAIVLVALTSGNIGTLIRHRSLALPYLIWLSALGAQECARWLGDRHGASVERSQVDGSR